MIGAMKRQSKIVKYTLEHRKGDDAGGLEIVLEELVEVYMVVIAATGFLEVSFFPLPCCRECGLIFFSMKTRVQR